MSCQELHLRLIWNHAVTISTDNIQTCVCVLHTKTCKICVSGCWLINTSPFIIEYNVSYVCFHLSANVWHKLPLLSVGEKYILHGTKAFKTRTPNVKCRPIYSPYPGNVKKRHGVVLIQGFELSIHRFASFTHMFVVILFHKYTLTRWCTPCTTTLATCISKPGPHWRLMSTIVFTVSDFTVRMHTPQYNQDRCNASCSLKITQVPCSSIIFSCNDYIILSIWSTNLVFFRNWRIIPNLF